MNVSLISGLQTDGVAVIDGFLNRNERLALGVDFDRRYSDGNFRRAGVGKGSGAGVHDDIRTDQISWWRSEDFSESQALVWARLDALRVEINEALFLGLWSLEAHYALYPAGGFYHRHIDRFENDSRRALSIVLYLNDSWEPSYGGALRIYPLAKCADGESRCLEIFPTPGTLVTFLSDTIPHEVLKTQKERRSVAGWFLRRPI